MLKVEPVSMRDSNDVGPFLANLKKLIIRKLALSKATSKFLGRTPEGDNFKSADLVVDYLNDHLSKLEKSIIKSGLYLHTGESDDVSMLVAALIRAMGISDVWQVNKVQINDGKKQFPVATISTSWKSVDIQSTGFLTLSTKPMIETIIGIPYPVHFGVALFYTEIANDVKGVMYSADTRPIPLATGYFEVSKSV